MKVKFYAKPYKDFKSKKWIMAFESDEQPVCYDRLKDKDIRLELKEYKEKRSLNANAYFHVLVGKIAEKQGLTHSEVHNQLIADYGYMDEDIKTVILDDDIPYLRIDAIHLKPTDATKILDNGKLYRVYIVMRGSHTYDTKEMSRLIDGTVSEAKELGIETMIPDELKRMVEQWKVS